MRIFVLLLIIPFIFLKAYNSYFNETVNDRFQYIAARFVDLAQFMPPSVSLSAKVGHERLCPAAFRGRLMRPVSFEFIGHTTSLHQD